MKNSILRVQRAFFPISCGVAPIAVYDIIHGTSELQITLKDWNLDQRAGNFLELSCVNAILAFKKPKNVFEFGTGYGRMSYQFSLNTPDDCHIYTLDIFDAERFVTE